MRHAGGGRVLVGEEGCCPGSQGRVCRLSPREAPEVEVLAVLWEPRNPMVALDSTHQVLSRNNIKVMLNPHSVAND